MEHAISNVQFILTNYSFIHCAIVFISANTAATSYLTVPQIQLLKLWLFLFGGKYVKQKLKRDALHGAFSSYPAIRQIQGRHSVGNLFVALLNLIK